jgi:hypothetical protein
MKNTFDIVSTNACITWMALLLCAMQFQGFAQATGKIEFQKTVHNFGQIKEIDGPVEATFYFKNAGTVPLSLTDVQATCGCTTPAWSKEPVEPGQEGFVKAVYDPKNRPGEFSKVVQVKTNGQPEMVLLKIFGQVEPRPLGPEDYYPIEAGNLRFNSSHVSFGEIHHDGTDTASLVLYNQGKDLININFIITKFPPFLTVTSNATAIGPRETLTLTFTYDATKKNDWGYVFDYFLLETDDKEQAKKRINVSANIIENFEDIPFQSPLPTIYFDRTTHHFGKMPVQSKSSTKFSITNKGEGVLFLRKTKASCGCTATRPDKMELAPGETTFIHVTFDSGPKAGAQRKSITVISNDRKQPSTTLWIEAEVTDKAEIN